jgi:hypothetical protein
MDYADYPNTDPAVKLIKNRYDAQVDASSRRFLKRVEHYYITNYKDDYGSTYHDVEYGVEIAMSRDSFQDLYQDLSKLQQLDESMRRIDIEYATLRASAQREQQLRDSNPALQKAYDKYKLILDMVSGRNDGKNS